MKPGVTVKIVVDPVLAGLLAAVEKGGDDIRAEAMALLDRVAEFPPEQQVRFVEHLLAGWQQQYRWRMGFRELMDKRGKRLHRSTALPPEHLGMDRDKIRQYEIRDVLVHDVAPKLEVGCTYALRLDEEQVRGELVSSRVREPDRLDLRMLLALIDRPLAFDQRWGR